MPIYTATDENLDEILSQHKVVIAQFWAPWCGPCRTLEPIVEQLANEFEEQVHVVKVNADINPVSAIKHQLQGIPSLRLFVEGKEAASLLGVQPISKLREWVKPYI